jgi:hypothetical protein
MMSVFAQPDPVFDHGNNSGGQKALFKLKNIFNNIPCSAPNFMHIFDHTVKPFIENHIFRLCVVNFKTPTFTIFPSCI